MFGFNFLLNITLFFFTIIHLENIFYFFYKKILLLYIKKKKRLNLELQLFYYNLNPKLVFSFNLVVFFFYKIIFIFNLSFFFNKLVLILIIFFFIYSIVVYLLSFIFLLTNIFIIFLINSLFLFLFLFIFCNSYLSYLFFIEIFSVYYFFFFLDLYNKNSLQNIFKYKNFILYFLWNSYLTTLFFGLGLVGILYEIGSLDFYFLSFFKFNPLTSLLLFSSLG